jgi:hypothetical protein
MIFQPSPWLCLGFLLIMGEGWRMIIVPGVDHP